MQIRKSATPFFLFCLLYFFASYRDSLYLVKGHDARPGKTRKHARNTLHRLTSKGKGTICGYYPSWETYSYKLKDIHPAVDVVIVAFMFFEIEYNNSLQDLSSINTLKSKIGLEFNEPITTFMNQAKELRKARPDILILISLGGVSYAIKDHQKALDIVPKVAHFIDAVGFDGVDIDYEPSGGFDLLNTKSYADFYVNYILELRKYICGDKIISVSLSSNGAFSCIGIHAPDKLCAGDPKSPYNHDSFQQNKHSAETYRLANMLSSGTTIYIMEQVKEKIDIIFIQSYNALSPPDGVDSILDIYKSHLYYALKYNYVVYVGLNIIEKHINVRANDTALMNKLLSVIRTANKKHKRGDGIGIWALLVNDRYIKEETFLDDFKKKLA